jgi:hypothetical protein
MCCDLQYRYRSGKHRNGLEHEKGGVIATCATLNLARESQWNMQELT